MRIVVTAGPTREAIDPVRFLSNRSTGRMGFAVAQAAAELRHRVTLVAGPVALPTPDGVERRDVVSALEMLSVLQELLPSADALVMCAAVADWRPKNPSPVKLKKSAMSGTLELVPNPDILSRLRPLKGGRIFVGFAAETGEPLAEASRKLRDKGLDMICANDVSEPGCGFAVETNRITLVTVSGVERLPLMSKVDAARVIVERMVRL
ncbi:MAG: phosphopantothenoylcysteine decarboxylase [Kiritimatiellia bacterium]|nr:phosphopantothenoylcysteine decarboxylase [Kiritimatiellia bacterium]